MQKSYKIDGSLGQITNRLEDKIQSQGNTSLRERSFETLENFIPTSDYLARSINGVRLEHLISNEPSKSFSVKSNGQDIVLHIFQDKIITSVHGTDYIFLDAIPEDLVIDIYSVSSCIKITDEGKEKILFNSSSGIIFCDITIISIYDILDGKYFNRIYIPNELESSNIQNITANVYILSYIRPNPYTSIPEIGFSSIIYRSMFNSPSQNNLVENFSDRIFIEGNFKIGDIVSLENVQTVPVIPTTFFTNTTFKTNIQGRKVIGVFKFAKFVRDGVTMVYPYINDSSSTSQLLLPEIEKGKATTIVDPTITEENLVDLFLLSGDSPIMDSPPLSTKTLELLLKYAPRYTSEKVVVQSQLVNYTYTLYKVFFFCATTISAKASVVKSDEKSVGYGFYSLAGRLAISYKNNLRFSAINKYTDFTIPETPTQATPFTRTLQDVDEITFISKWGLLGVEEGYAIGTRSEIIFFSSVANIFSLSILNRSNIPCCHIPPLDIRVGSLQAVLIVEANKKKITSVIFSKDQIAELVLTEGVNFFDKDLIEEITSVSYGKDQMIFVLTEAKNLYACITGEVRLSWFKIVLPYRVENITSINSGTIQKLYVVCNIGNLSNYNIVGSLDVNEVNYERKCAFYSDDVALEDDYVFYDENPLIEGEEPFKKSSEITKEQKLLIVKPIVCKLTLHNQEIINSKYNTKASRTKRSIKNVNINVRSSNNFTVKYKVKNKNQNEREKVVYDIQRNDGNLNPTRVKELVSIFRASPVCEEAKIEIETNKNSLSPVIIQSISFDTEYANI